PRAAKDANCHRRRAVCTAPRAVPVKDTGKPSAPRWARRLRCAGGMVPFVRPLHALLLSGLLAGSSLAVADEASAPTPPPDPFAFADFSWIPGKAGGSERALATKYFTGEIRIDTAYHYSFNHPKDNTIGGSSEVFRSNELQVTQIGFGGDFN